MTRLLLNKTADTSSASTSSASTSSPTIPQVSNLIYSNQIKQLNDMGFNNHNLNLNGKLVCFKIILVRLIICLFRLIN